MKLNANGTRNYNGHLRRGIVDKEDLAHMVAEVLDIPSSHRARPGVGKNFEIVRAIFNSMAKALQRGEEVRIPGFGILKHRIRPARKHYFAIYPHSGSNTPTPGGKHTEWSYGYIGNLPEKKYVHFEPSKVFLRMLNENGNPS